MIPLEQTQLRFQRYVIDDAVEVVDEIAGPDAQFRNVRLGIYRNAYRLRLVEALATDYETLKALVGDEVFGELARDYIAAQPSVFRNLRWFGSGLAGFLRTAPRYAPHGVLADLAEFEWTLGLAFDAADAPALEFDQLTALSLDDWPCVTFCAHPSLRLVYPRWNVTAIWHAVNDGAAIPGPVSGRPTPIVIWRKGLSPCFRSLEGDEAALWASIRAGTTFAAACEELANRVDAEQAPNLAAGLLRRWVDDGWLTRFVIAD